MLDNLRIVLVGTTHPGNIGATARAMKNMHCQHLYLVQPKQFPAAEATARASGADDILQHAVVVETLEEALAECHTVFATSARSRHFDVPVLTPKLAAEKVKASITQQKIAIVFGREHSGLRNDELEQSHYHIQIPTNTDFCSLNLAQAVQIICYEIFAHMALDSETKADDKNYATHEELEQFYAHLETTLIDIAFLNPQAPRKLMTRLRRFFQRVRLEHDEVAIARGICAKITENTTFSQERI